MNSPGVGVDDTEWNIQKMTHATSMDKIVITIDPLQHVQLISLTVIVS